MICRALHGVRARSIVCHAARDIDTFGVVICLLRKRDMRHAARDIDTFGVAICLLRKRDMFTFGERERREEEK